MTPTVNREMTTRKKDISDFINKSMRSIEDIT